MNVGALAVVTALGIGSIALFSCAVRSRHTGSRLRSIARPLHELRGALTALELGLTALERAAQRREPDPSGTGLGERLDALRAQLERLAVAADDLECQRNGQVPSPRHERREAVELGAIVRRSVMAWTAIAPDYGARIELRWPAAEVWVGGQAGRLRQVIDNLIANALQHGGGRVLVRGELARSRVRVAVTDGGTGLPAELADLTEAPWRSVHGHGLAIVREIVEGYGGRLAARTTAAGPGMAFDLPVAEASSGRVGAPASVRARGSGRREPFPAAMIDGERGRAA